MVFRNSMRSIFRSMGKTALFTLLIFALTLALSLGVSVWTSVAQFLDECNEYFTTIGLIEYMGTDYPGDTRYDPAMDQALETLDAAAIASDEAALLWQETTRSMGYIDGFWRTDNFVPGRGNSVFVVGNISYNERHDQYNAFVIEVLYSLQIRPNTIILIDGDFGAFEKDHYYLVFGEVYDVGSPLLNLRGPAFDHAIATSLGIEVPRIQDISSSETDQNYLIPGDSLLVKAADTLQVTNNSVLVSETEDLMSGLPFHQEELWITSGRAFTPDEYARGDQVIVVSELIASRLGIGIGDKIALSIAVADQPGVYSSYWVESGFSYQSAFEVVGITNTIADKSWYVYVPKSADMPSSPFPVGYTVGHVIVRNDEAAAFNARIESMLQDRFRLTIYDQGYSDVAIPFKTILRVSKIVTGVCVLVELAVIILFGFLFVYRQRETSETMLFLGAGRLRVTGHFLFGAGLISLIASSAGAVAGYFLHDGIIALVAGAAERFTLIDSRYSNGNLSISRTLEFAPHLEIELFLYVGAAIFAMALLACMTFVITTFPSRRLSQRNPKGPKKGRKTSLLRGGSLKYAVLSTFRGGTRTLVVPVLAMVVVIFFGQLASTVLRYQEQLETIYDNTTITGSYTDIKGKQIGGLVLSAYDIANLYHSGQVSTLTASISKPYYYLGTSILADGTDLNIPPLYVPASGFAAESLEGEIMRGPDLTAINDIRTSPEFLFADTILMDFMEGYDESFLTVPSGDPRVFSCLVPSSLMEEQNIHFGDTIRAAINDPYKSQEYVDKIHRHYDLKVIGSYEKQGATDTIYVPLSLFFDTSLIWGAGQVSAGAPVETISTGYTLNEAHKEELLSTTFNSTHFTLADTRSLSVFKDYLSTYGYSQVHNIGSVRAFLVLDDASFNNAVASVKQQINYINTLYPFLYLLVGIIAIVTSYLLVVSRKMELAVMRGLGTTRIRTFLSFFLEQSLLCLLGTIIGFLVWFLVWGPPMRLHLALTAGFIVCYFLGSAVSVRIMNHANVLTILTDKD
ncbi:MAG: ABC transporter permease [Anaerolineales bacterium]|nr:ABC transporter permease [Anaerolineales bacterium]